MTQVQAHNAKPFIWIIFNIQHTYMNIYKTRTTYEQLRTLLRWEMSQSLELQGQRTIKSLYKSWNTLTIVMPLMILFHMLNIILILLTPSQVLLDAYKSQNTSSMQPPSRKNIHMMLLWQYSIATFCPDLVLYIMYDSMKKMYHIDLKITVQPLLSLITVYFIKQLWVIQITLNPSQILHTISH